MQADMQQHVTTLTAGDSRLVLVPGTGGSIGTWQHRGEDILRPAGPEALAAGNPRALGCFPMIPFSGRIGRGRFAFGGEEFRLDRNFGDHPHSIHGNAWQRPWTVAASGADHARLGFVHDAAGMGARSWPYSYRAELDYRLEPERLTVAMTVENRDPRAMPAGMGLHPYFPRSPDTTLGFRAGGVWLDDLDHLPASRAPVPAEWRFHPERTVGEPGLDNCFQDWDRVARLTWPGLGRVLIIEVDPPFGHLVVFTPEGRGFFCVEPVSHVPNAVNLADQPGHGLVVLAPGETLAASARFTLSHKKQAGQ